MQGQSKKLNHPFISYILGFVIMLITLTVFIGVIYHMTISPDGPGLLRPLLTRYEKSKESPILIAAKRREEMVKHKHFHIVVPYPQIPEDKRPVCYICHSDLPHKKNKKIRSLMNMHTQYLVCETCHIKEKPGTEIVYKWYSPFEKNPKGPFFGTDYDHQTEALIKGNKYAKIAPYVKTNLEDYSSKDSVKTDKLQLAIQIQDAPMAKDFMRVRDQLTPDQRASVTNQFHENIKPKGFQCKECHNDKKSILNFKALGFSEKRITDLTTLEIVGIITRYQEFYLPEFFKDNASNSQ